MSAAGSPTDIDGVRVGHHHRRRGGYLTGTSVVFVPDGAVAAVDVRGGGPGTREIAALGAGNLVEEVHAVCLSGGSAFGLAAADGVVAELETRGLGVPVPLPDGRRTVVPVVPAAVVFDLGRGGDPGARPDAEFGRRALRAANRRPARGAVGAGTGARAGGLQGGVGMASMLVELPGAEPVRVAALAVVNAVGSVIDPTTGSPWWPDPRLRRPPASQRRALADALAGARAPSLNTTIGVVITDALLARPQVGRLALAAHDGLARAVRPAHALTDGDLVVGLSTGSRDLAIGDARDLDAARVGVLNRLTAVAADVFAAACADAVVSAQAVGDAPAYRDLCPGAYR